MIYSNHEQLIAAARARTQEMRVVGVIAADDDHTLEAVSAAYQAGVVRPRLFGNAARIRQKLAGLGLSPEQFDITAAESPEDAARLAAYAARDGEVHLLMKGGIATGKMLRVLFEPETKFRRGSLISHLSIVQVDTYHKLFGITDTAINVYPSLEQKADLISNAVEAMTRMGFDQPKVAVLAASEDVSSKIVETVEARALQEMNERGEIGGCVVEGPLSFDLAMDPEAATIKKCTGVVPGDADLLLAPNIAAGNILIKCLRVCAKAHTAGFVAGGRVPIALSSRAASAEDKLLPISLAAAATF